MNIIISGGSGQIGQALCQHLKAKNHDVSVLTRSPKSSNEIYWNPAKGEIDAKKLEKAEVIIHLAGASVGKRWSASYKKEILDSRVKSTQLLFNTIKQHKIELKHFIGASGIGYYGNTADQLVNEDSEIVKNDFLVGVCQEWERAERQFQELCATSIVRIGFVLGHGFDGFDKLVQPVRLFAGAPLGDGSQFMSWIHIDDLVRIFEFAFEKDVRGVINGVSNQPVTNKELTKEIASCLKKPLFLPPVPRFALKLLLGEMAELALNSGRVESQVLKANNFKFKYAELKDALKALLC